MKLLNPIFAHKQAVLCKNPVFSVCLSFCGCPREVRKAYKKLLSNLPRFQVAPSPSTFDRPTAKSSTIFKYIATLLSKETHFANRCFLFRL